MAALPDLVIVIEPDLTEWQRAVARAVLSTDRLVLSLNRARRVASDLGRSWAVGLTVRPLGRCELAAQRRIDQAMRQRARRAARRTRRAAARAARVGA